MCRLLGVSRSAYYEYERYRRNRPDGLHRKQLLDAIRDIAKSCDYTYGSRRMKRALHASGYSISRWKTKELMREASVAVRHRKKHKVATDSNHPLPVFENQLNRQFTVAKPDRVYVCDITYIWTQESWLYLAVVIDLFSRKVVGWSMSSRMKASLVCDALRMAIWLRRPLPGLIVHSDRGSQYASKAYRNLLKAYGFIGSMVVWEIAGIMPLQKASLADSSRNVANGGIIKLAMKHSRTFCSISPCFIIISRP